MDEIKKNMVEVPASLSPEKVDKIFKILDTIIDILNRIFGHPK